MKNSFNKEIGFSPLECVDVTKMRNVIRVVKTILAKYYTPQTENIILVAGAGKGDEALLIADEYKLKTIGVDINIENIKTVISNIQVVFQKHNLLSLGFKQNSFSVVYSYHVLEHVDNPEMMLLELHRVLKPNGILFIGFPNKNRFFSYFGTSQKASLLEKLKWNMVDYIFKIKGKFENKYGAHAGFAEKEFIDMASKFFNVTYAVRDEYMLHKYVDYHYLIKLIIRTRLGEFLFPSNYFVCIKGNN
jgi:2-polyprenyl-3-methyl-5-hydroxy-6-metoxy-1,4-benzoquinol methylase